MTRHRLIALAAVLIAVGLSVAPTPIRLGAPVSPAAPIVPVPAAAHTVETVDVAALMARIRACESHGNYRARNRRTSAAGAYQFVTSTWRRYRGAEGRRYVRASHAPPTVQDHAFLRAYAHEGTRPWASSRSCWATS